MMKQVLFTCGLALALASSVNQSVAQGTSVKSTELPKGWHMLDKAKDGFYGVSVQQAYDLVKGKKSTPVLVAVIDSGVDTLHEDLKDILWTNPKEIPGNGIDDDKNGYIDDIHGWNFLGGKDGRNVKEDSYEGARVYHQLKPKYEGKTIDVEKLTPEQRDEYTMWLKVKEKIEGDAMGGGADLLLMKRALDASLKNDSVLRAAIGREVYTGSDLDTFSTTNADASRAKAGFLYLFKANNMMDMSNKDFLNDFKEYVSGQERKKEAIDKAPEDYRGEITKDNEADINDRYYGNNDVMAGTPMHGTHVTGIIAAKRNNGKGMDGIADNVRVMMIRAVPDGDEHDKDVANAIRYAVDNGARVVNMSFGKGFSPNKNWVDDAVKYAESKGVLLVHAAGNDAENVDSTDNFPNPTLRAMKSRANNWITVGASSELLAEPIKTYTASFSNYGKQEVDVFAPGTKIYATLPGGNNYGNLQGTSMASPVVAGVAALVLSYYPTLTPAQLKYVIMKSAVKPDAKVKVPGQDKLVDLSDISQSGGIINAYGAMKLAATIKPENKSAAPKSTLKKTSKG
jgi:cell wall-associated protease